MKQQDQQPICLPHSVLKFCFWKVTSHIVGSWTQFLFKTWVLSTGGIWGATQSSHWVALMHLFSYQLSTLLAIWCKLVPCAILSHQISFQMTWKMLSFTGGGSHPTQEELHSQGGNCRFVLWLWMCPWAGDVEMIQLILKSLERSWVCPFPGQPVCSSEIPGFGTVPSWQLDTTSCFGCCWLCLGWWYESKGWDMKESPAGFECPSVQSLGWNCRLPHSPFCINSFPITSLFKESSLF